MMDREWNDSQPIYRQLRDRVVAMILDGVLREGDPLPSVRTVAAEYRVILAQCALTDDKQKLRDTDWDFLAQHALGLAAAAHAAGDDAKDWRPLVAKLQQALAFPPDAGGKRYDCPKDYDAKTVLDLFQALDAKLTRPGGDR